MPDTLLNAFYMYSLIFILTLTLADNYCKNHFTDGEIEAQRS